MTLPDNPPVYVEPRHEAVLAGAEAHPSLRVESAWAHAHRAVYDRAVSLARPEPAHDVLSWFTLHGNDLMQALQAAAVMAKSAAEMVTIVEGFLAPVGA